jgi:hypothetical protein
MVTRGSVPYEPASIPAGPLSLDCRGPILNGRVTEVGDLSIAPGARDGAAAGARTA